MTKFDDYAREVTELVRTIGPLLAGKPPAVQSAALADLLAIWVVGHRDRRGNKKTALEFQEIVLNGHIELVRKLIAVNSLKAYRERG